MQTHQEIILLKQQKKGDNPLLESQKELMETAKSWHINQHNCLFETTFIEPGISLGIWNGLIHTPFQGVFDWECPNFIIMFCLRGSNLNTFYRKSKSFEEILSLPGSVGIRNHYKSHGKIEFNSNNNNCTVVISVDPIIIQNFCESALERMPESFARALDKPKSNRFFHRQNILPDMKIALHQILSSKPDGFSAEIYIKIKVMELIHLTLLQLVFFKPPCLSDKSIHPDDLKKIKKAVEILTRDLQCPPSLAELCCLLGITRTKLNNCFKEVYGKTAFSYLADYRLEKAKTLIEDGQFNITEIADTVGYNYQSHLSRAFQRKFSISPKSYQLAARKFRI